MQPHKVGLHNRLNKGALGEGFQRISRRGVDNRKLFKKSGRFALQTVRVGRNEAAIIEAGICGVCGHF